MAIITSSVRTLQAHPNSTGASSSSPEGKPKRESPGRLVRAICVDVIDLGMVQTDWGFKPRFRIVFELDELNDSGYSRTASRTFTKTPGKKGSLHATMKSWLGRAPRSEELVACYTTPKLLNQPCRVRVKERLGPNGRRIHCIEKILPNSGEPMSPSGYYRRWTN